VAALAGGKLAELLGARRVALGGGDRRRGATGRDALLTARVGSLPSAVGIR
jgi:hypothetical protein